LQERLFVLLESLKAAPACVRVEVKSLNCHFAGLPNPKESPEMATLNMTESELEKLIKRAIISTLTERSDLLENAVTEAILDMKLGLAIEEGDTGEYVDEKQISSLIRD
jgi:hypothetical protein